jgi:hypothetical protein
MAEATWMLAAFAIHLLTHAEARAEIDHPKNVFLV